MNYILVDKKPVKEPDLMTWATWMQISNRRVKLTHIDFGVKVSTVFLGVDHQFREKGAPILFESIIFGGERNGECYRYSTWDEAVAGHDEIVNSMPKSIAAQIYNALVWLFGNFK